MARILAIDYGFKRTGLAVTDPLKMFATDLETVRTHDLIDFITKYNETEGIESFVLGEPKTLANIPSETSGQIEAFKNRLQKLFPDKKIHRVDERFTSSIALQTISMSGMSKKKREEKGRADVIAAVLILQTYLQMNSI
jgi:putative Holliday junction resolvase